MWTVLEMRVSLRGPKFTKHSSAATWGLGANENGIVLCLFVICIRLDERLHAPYSDVWLPCAPTTNKVHLDLKVEDFCVITKSDADQVQLVKGNVCCSNMAGNPPST